MDEAEKNLSVPEDRQGEKISVKMTNRINDILETEKKVRDKKEYEVFRDKIW